ncbi:MAG: acyltransferase [Chlorobiaceae bacterium]|nr:acyltransferase [Chlorobiaceae bacterium]
MLASFIGAWCLFHVVPFKQFDESVATTALFCSNILFWLKSGDYFAAPSAEIPLLHTWSLAVEEQFYIVFPLFLVAINQFLKRKYFPWILAMAIISFAVSVYVMHINKSAAFYLAPTRAWELLVGAIIALNAIHSIKNNFLRNGFSVFGLGMIGYSIFFYTEKTLFPGSAALLPVLGAGLIIYSGQCGGTGIGRFLSLRPLVFTGLISYSLYLWHWPLLVFSKYFLMRELIPPETAGVIILTFIFSFFSWKFIEQPFRSKPPLLVHRSGLFAVSGLVMAVAVIAGVLVFKKDGLPKRFLGNPMIYAMEYDPFWKPESWSQGNLVTDNVKAIRLGTPQEFLILLRNIKTLGYGIHCWRERPVAFWWH